jgi:hypothetical protein
MPRNSQIQITGLPTIHIEDFRGERRNGKPVAYGFFEGTIGNDGDPVDVFVGRYQTDKAFVMYQLDREGRYNETKVFVGVPSRRMTLDIYRRSYPKGAEHNAGPIAQMNLLTLGSWLRAGGGARPLHADVPMPNEPEQYQQGGAVAAAEPTTAQQYYGELYDAARHLFGGDQAINELMRHYGGAVSGSSSA